MFTPLSTGSERAQDNLWDRTNSPRKPRTRPPLTPISTRRALTVGLSSGSTPGPGPGAVASAGPTSQLSPRARSVRPPRARSELGVPPGLILPAAVPAHPASRAVPGGKGRGRGHAQSPSVGSGVPVERTLRHKASQIEDEVVGRWTGLFFRPGRRTVEGWLGSFWKRHFILTLLPCIAVWIWVAVPFPVSDPYSDDPFPDIPTWPKRPKTGTGNDTHTGDGDGDDNTVLPLDVNFYFFLFWYFGMYLAVALFFITNLFSLYRLNWWPSALGGKLSYTLFWATTLLVGLAAHHLDLFHLHERWEAKQPGDNFDWERKTFWVVLSFAAMLMPAIACFSKLKRDKRHVYRHATAIQDTFFGQSFSRRIPSSWLRFLWFMTCLAIASFSLIAGQAYASLFLSTLPHTSLDAGTWVWSWVITVQLLAQISYFILSSKVRSRALLFLYKLFFQLVYHVFYRNLFARLRSPVQFATVQLLSSISVVIIFPFQMTKLWHRALQVVVGYPHSWEVHVENVAIGFYCRSMAQNVTMVGFLGWLSILHFGPNSQIYPFFRFSPTAEDPYTFGMTFIASCAVWGSELLSSFVARQVMALAFKVDVGQIGLDEMREYPELVPACGWASVHVSMNILMFLIKLNFR